MAAVTKDEIRAEIADRKARLEAIDAENAGERFDDVTRNEWNTLNTEVDELEARVEELIAREERLMSLSTRTENMERI